MKLRIKLGAAPQRLGGRESLQAPLTFSMLFHGALFGVLLFGGVLVAPNRGQDWGDEGFGGGASVPVNLAPSVPLAAAAGKADNPLASATRELHPLDPKPAEKGAPPPSARELQIAERDLKKSLAEMERRQALKELAQLRREVSPEAIPGATSAGRVASPIYGMATGQGAGGIGFSGEFGALYGWYVRAVRECISRHWDRGRVDASVRSARRVYVEFDVQRDGTIRNERITTSSSNPSVDREALRAVQACSGRSEVGAEAKLPPLPRDYSGSSVHVEVWFEFHK